MMDRDNLLRLYITEGKSLRVISKILKKAPSTILTALAKHNIPIRTKSEAQKSYLAEGQHQMLGKHHSNETKQKISESLEEFWNSLSPKDRAELKETIGDAWRNKWASMSKADRAKICDRLNTANQKNASGVSKFAIYIGELLLDAGIAYVRSSRDYTPNKKFEIDYFLHLDNIAIEIDGPIHFEPIFGIESLEIQQERDARKNDILLGAGLKVIRIRDNNGSRSKMRGRAIIAKILEIMKSKEKRVWYV